MIGKNNLNLAPHEILSAWLVSTNYLKEILSEIENKMNEESGIEEIKINQKDIINIILGLPIENPSKSFLSNIIHGEVDADRIDYLLRDAYHTGVPHGHIDLDYLLSTFCLIPIEKSGLNESLKLGVQKKGLPSVIALFLSRATMYPTVYLHHTTKIAEEMYLRALYEAITNHNFNSLNLLQYNNFQIMEYLRTIPGIPFQMIERLSRRDLYKRAVTYEFQPEITSNSDKGEFSLTLKLNPEIIDFKFYHDFQELIDLERRIANEIKLDSSETVIFNIPKIPTMGKIDADKTLRIKMPIKNEYYPINQLSFLFSAIDMENFQNWELQICCPNEVKKELIEYIRTNPPFTILQNLSSMEY